jgi:hypothetical protein
MLKMTGLSSMRLTLAGPAMARRVVLGPRRSAHCRTLTIRASAVEQQQVSASCCRSRSAGGPAALWPRCLLPAAAGDPDPHNPHPTLC